MQTSLSSFHMHSPQDGFSMTSPTLLKITLVIVSNSQTLANVLTGILPERPFGGLADLVSNASASYPSTIDQAEVASQSDELTLCAYERLTMAHGG